MRDINRRYFVDGTGIFKEIEYRTPGSELVVKLPGAEVPHAVWISDGEPSPKISKSEIAISGATFAFAISYTLNPQTESQAEHARRVGAKLPIYVSSWDPLYLLCDPEVPARFAAMVVNSTRTIPPDLMLSYLLNL